MIRLAGALFMLLGSAFWGFSGVARLRGRVRSLASLNSAVGVLKSEICGRAAPLPEVMEQLSREADYPARVFFRRVVKKLPRLGKSSFSDIWREAARESSELFLKEMELTALCAVGSALGRYGIEEQGRELDYVSRRLEGFLKTAEEERKRDSGMNAALGVAAGVFCVIILL